MVVVVLLELLFIGYLVTQAFRSADWTSPLYVLGAVSLAVLTGIVWSTRLRRKP